jgi:nicotinamide-nucleotide amidase
MITAEIVTIGDEIISGHLTDTNSKAIALMLNEAGFLVQRIISVGDNEEQIMGAITENKYNVNVNVKIFSGGLGPTHDDRTKDIACKAFRSQLICDNDVLQNIQNIFQQRNLELTDRNREQAMVPHNCKVLMNETGTAPGLFFLKDNTLYIFLPAVPFEMLHLMKTKVMPLLLDTFGEQNHFHVSDFVFSGIGESFLVDLLKEKIHFEFETSEIAFLPSPGMIIMRQTLNYSTVEDAEKVFQSIDHELNKNVYEFYLGRNINNIAALLQKTFIEKKIMLSVAESCTGGYLSHLITSNAGSSAWFSGGWITYSNAMKINQLGVSKTIIEEQGAVSEQVVSQMALGAKEKAQSDYSVAISGIAGPEGGTSEKPVGTVWIAVATPKGDVLQQKFSFGNSPREVIIKRSAIASMLMLVKVLKEN